MVNNGDRDLGLDAPQSRAAERQALRSAMKRAARAQRRLHEAIYRAATCGEACDTSSSSESDGEGTAFRGRRRNAGEGDEAQFHHHQQGPWTGRRHGMRGAHRPWASMRGFASGRHTMGFPGCGAGFPGMMSHPHPHPHHHHHHHHGPHHHHRGAFGDFHSFAGRGGHCGRGGHGHGPSPGAFGRHFPHFGGGMGHCSGYRERARSVPRF
ncbi:serine/threonine-protein phosphatase 1 regulatory subunit 10-like [Zeugodacus cucurbitae]|uniref:serine/threonine-protein phosphatase 1 regulatory subunit 10-like n=1 Tax=Zeugodacus cucurbitae TaxID=28588 RepID=UPI0010A7465B|nr:serine/threonine-protein phosphatase 1 regulatory subunit 10-like [Zeugodacus cucurbitae]